VIIYLGSMLPLSSSSPPIPSSKKKLNGQFFFLCGHKKTGSTWPCSEWECQTFDITAKPVSSYPTISPLPSRIGGCIFSVAVSFPSPRTSCYEAFCPMEFGLSSPSIKNEATTGFTLDQRTKLAVHYYNSQYDKLSIFFYLLLIVFLFIPNQNTTTKLTSYEFFLLSNLQ